MDQLNKRRLAEYLAELRKSRGLSLDEMGYLFHVSGRTVRRWENGDVTPTIEDLFNICREFNVSLEDFFTPAEKNDQDEKVMELNGETPVTATNNEANNNAHTFGQKTIKYRNWILALLIISVTVSGTLYYYAKKHGQTVSKETYSIQNIPTDRIIEGISIMIECDGENLFIAVFNNSEEDIVFYGSFINPSLYTYLTDGWHRVYKERNAAPYLDRTVFVEKGEGVIITADCVESYGGILPYGTYCLELQPVSADNGRQLTYLVEFQVRT